MSGGRAGTYLWRTGSDGRSSPQRIEISGPKGFRTISVSRGGSLGVSLESRRRRYGDLGCAGRRIQTSGAELPMLELVGSEFVSGRPNGLSARKIASRLRRKAASPKKATRRVFKGGTLPVRNSGRLLPNTRCV